MSTLTYSGSLTVVTCWCGMRHAVPYVPLSVRHSRVATWLWPRFPRFMDYDRARWLARRLP